MREDLLPTTFEGKVSRVIEECGEVLQAIGKAQRFGWFATDAKTGKTYDNAAHLDEEMSQLQHALKTLQDDDDFVRKILERGRDAAHKL